MARITESYIYKIIKAAESAGLDIKEVLGTTEGVRVIVRPSSKPAQNKTPQEGAAQDNTTEKAQPKPKRAPALSWGNA